MTMLKDSSHNEIWESLRNGDRSSLLALYKAFYLGLVNYGFKMTGDPALTRDCITQVLLRLWDNRHTLPEVKNPGSYLLSCLRHEIYGELKAENTRSLRARSIQRFFGDKEPSYEDLLIEAQTSQILKGELEKALKKLTDREKELLRLKFFEDLDYDEIADRCNIAKRTAYNIIHNALKSLRMNLVVKPDNDWISNTSFLSLLLLLLVR